MLTKTMGEINTLLKELSEEEDPRTLRHIIGKLGNLKDSRVVDPLIELLDNVAAILDEPDFYDIADEINQWERLIKSICKELGKLRDRRAVPSLIDLIESYNREWTYHAILALDKLGDESAITTLIMVVESSEKIEIMRKYSANVLGKMRTENSIEALIRLIQSKDEHNRKIAVSALYRNIYRSDAFYEILVAINNDSERISTESKNLQDLIDRDAGIHPDGSVVSSKARPAIIEPTGKKVFYDPESQEYFYIDEDGNEVDCDIAGRDLVE